MDPLQKDESLSSGSKTDENIKNNIMRTDEVLSIRVTKIRIIFGLIDEMSYLVTY